MAMRCCAALRLALFVRRARTPAFGCTTTNATKRSAPRVMDAAALDCVQRFGAKAELAGNVKEALLQPLLGRFSDGIEARSLFDWLARVAQSLAAVLEGAEKNMFLPELAAARESEK